jgi:hypothetical protein
MCIFLTGGEGGQADVLEDQLDRLGDILDPLGIASSFIGLTTSTATTIAVGVTGAPILSNASVALFLGLTGPELLIVGGLALAALGIVAEVTSYEMGQISENMDESLITSTGGTLTVSSVGGVFYT